MRRSSSGLFARYRWLLAHRRAVVAPAIAFEIWSTVIFIVCFAPASAWVVNRLVALGGQYAISDLDLLTFFLSLRGVLLVVLSAGFVLAFWFAEQVGLMIIVLKAIRREPVSVGLVLMEMLAELPALFRLGLIHAGAHLAVGAPFGVGVWLTKRLLLNEWDFYYYLNVRPTSWWIALAVAGTLVIVFLAVTAWLHVRWMLAVPALVVENLGPREALGRSWRETRGRVLELGLPLALGWLAVLTLSLATTFLIRAAAGQFLPDDDLSLRIVLPIVVGALILIALSDLLWFIVGKTLHVLLMTRAYLDGHDLAGEASSPEVPAMPATAPRKVRMAAWIIAIVAVVGGAGAGVAYVERLQVARTIEITGHRGTKVRAPENTLIAVQHAIDEGADFAEIDVQTTADGVVVLMHDGDLMRVASVRRRLDEIDRAELREIDVGSWFAPEFSDERVPTLQEVIDLARGRIRLNIELKYNRPDPMLAPKVVAIIRENGFGRECVVSSLSVEALAEVRRAAPELTTGLIVFRSVGNLPRMEADFLSISAASASPRLVRRAHREGRAVHVWTVNDFNSALAMIEAGVDNIITDQPRDIRSLIDAWQELSDAERVVLVLRNLVVEIDRPAPSDL